MPAQLRQMLMAEDSAKMPDKDQDHRLHLPECGQVNGPGRPVFHCHIRGAVTHAYQRRPGAIVLCILASHNIPHCM
jgi:hypothetical protein